jgi:hypothetical protein
VFSSTCFYWGGVIGRCEPLAVVAHDSDRETTLAREPELADESHAILAHVRCVPPRWWRERG